MPNLVPNLPTIKEVIKRYNLKPRKNLGQNFILDTDITDRIVLLAGDLKNTTVLEIGPGAGTLTRSLLASSAKKIIAIEMDHACIQALGELSKFYSEKLQIIHADALKIKEEELADPPLTIIANLPYNIGTELILKWLTKRELFTSITVMLQKEVVERITAQASTHHYGRLSIICQWLCEVEKKFDIEPYYFYPPPKVISTIVTLKPRENPLYNCEKSKLEQLTQLLFSKRRKMIRSILKDKIEESMLEKLSIDPTSRPENLTIKNFCDLANSVQIV